MTLTTPRLTLRRMAPGDAAFMLALLNTPGWLRFIGDRGVRTLAQAEQYIVNGPMATVAARGFGFDVVTLTASGEPIGICGLAQRDYLDAPDIGFAFLPDFGGQGFALEAAQAVMAQARGALGLARILATTRPDNVSSQRLLEKIGLRLDRTMPHPDVAGQTLWVYATPTAASSAAISSST
jgi:[ribosomal protein S5]-alanine N-acetyltransferase